MNKKRKIGILHLNLKLLHNKIKEWDKIIDFLKKRKGINKGRDGLIREAYLERNKINDEIQVLFRKFKE